MPTLLHLADLHLGWCPPLPSPERARERQARRDDVLRHAVDLALEERVDLVVLAGDLFDRHDPEPALLDRSLAQLGRLVEAGIDIVTVPGTHDEITYPTSVYRTRTDWPGFLVRSQRVTRVATLSRGNGTIHVYGAASVGGALARVEAFPKEEGAPGDIHVGLFHGRLSLQPPARERERGLVLDVAALERSGYHYVALGGVHRREVHRLGITTCAHPGLVESLGFEEPGAACFTLVRIEGESVEISTLPFPAQPLLTQVLDVTGADEAEIGARIRRMANPQAMVRLRLEGSPNGSLDLSRLSSALADDFFHLDVVDACERLDAGALDVWASELTILGQFVRRMQDRLALASSERERAVLERALRKGVEALGAEVAR